MILRPLGCPAQFKVWGWSLPSEPSYSFKACRRSSTACKGKGRGARGSKKKQQGYTGAIFIIPFIHYIYIYIRLYLVRR